MPEFVDGLMRPGTFDLAMIPGWAVYETIDEYGRRGSLVGVFDSEGGGKLAAKGVGWYGSEGSIDKVKLLLVGSGLGQMAIMITGPLPLPLNAKLADIQKKRRAEALAKLTPEDITLLGIKETG